MPTNTDNVDDLESNASGGQNQVQPNNYDTDDSDAALEIIPNARRRVNYNENANAEQNEDGVNGDGVNGDDDAEVAALNAFEDFESNLDSKEMTEVLQFWETKHTQTGYDPVPILKRLAEIIEKEMEIYMRKDPDPFDERHPYRTDPKCQFGFLLKQLFRKDVFMRKLVNDYLRDNYFTRQNIQKSSWELNIVACRLILVIMPGLETSAVFQDEYDNLINRIYGWAEDSIEPLQSYATGLLAAAMEVTDIAVTFRELNTRLVPKMIKRLHMMQAIYKSTRDISSPPTPTTGLNNSANGPFDRIVPAWMVGWAPQSPERNDESGVFTTSSVTAASGLDTLASNSNMSTFLDNSRDTGSNYYRKLYIPIHPPTAETRQMLILRYLAAMGEYQDLLGFVFEHDAMQLIFGYIERLDRRDTCLAFEALKYLASLLCHKKFALEFISRGGLELLLQVPRPSLAATGVSITLYYLAYSEDAMERIWTMPKPIIRDLVFYALWLLGRSYDSGKCHATMFFGLSFQFKVILDEFDAQDGLRKLYNVIAILKILNPTSNEDEDHENTVNEDIEHASRQLVRHVCVALKRYMESHLFYKYNAFMRQQNPISSVCAQHVTKATKATLEQISEQIRTLQENTSVRARWAPVDQLLKLGGIALLLKIIAFSYDWNNSGRSETVRSALDVLSICCIIPKVYAAYCDRLELPDNVITTGIYSILGAAAGDIATDADVQKSALAVLCHCVCSPIARKEPSLMKVFGSSSKRIKVNMKYSAEMVEKVWESVCSNNGIIVLLSLMQIKAPITDADCIRGMACRALAGLARSTRVSQIVGKLPLFASGQIQTLMRDPILQEKRSEHVIFQKYALELLERVSGKGKPFNSKQDPSLSNIHKANVIAQTKIQYNEQQLLQLIHEHLESKGMSKTAQMLQKEAGLQLPSNTMKNFHQSPFDYKVLPASSIARSRLRSRMQDVNMSINGLTAANELQLNSSFSEELQPSSALHHQHQPHQHQHQHSVQQSQHQIMQHNITPIKLVKKVENTSNSIASTSSSSTNLNASAHQRSMQKQISSFTEDSLQEYDDGAAGSGAGITLSTIVTEYLTNQHALCNNPMTTCPQFDLFTPHKCPDPQPNRVLGNNLNLSARIFKAQAGFNTAVYDRRYVHSNFAPWRSIRANDFTETQFLCCAFVPQTKLLLVGTQQGEAKAFNLNDSSEQFSGSCHNFHVDTIQASKVGGLVLTTSSWRAPMCMLWSIRNNEFTSKCRFSHDYYCEFSNLNADKLLGTQNDCASLYDTETTRKITTFKPSLPNQYTKNRATFSPTDELILSDGVLFDVRSGREIHKFDKLNQSLSGVFHPNGLEIISNTEVWDLRTFHLMQTVPVLDQCYVKFSPMHTIYGINVDNGNHIDFDENVQYETSFKVLDAYDYSSISTIDVKRNIFDMSISSNGSLIALVENQPEYDTKQETFVKLYAVGIKKSEEHEEVRVNATGDVDTDVRALSVVGRNAGRHLVNTNAASSNRNGGDGVVLDVVAAPRPSNAAGGENANANINLNVNGAHDNGNVGAVELAARLPVQNNSAFIIGRAIDDGGVGAEAALSVALDDEELRDIAINIMHMLAGR